MPEATTDDVAEAIEVLLPLLRRLVPADALSLPAAATLARLLRSGPARVSDLAAAEGVSQPAMSQLVARLERDGLLRRERAVSDARASLSTATAAGESALQKRREARTRALAGLIDRLPPADRDALAGAVPALRQLADLADVGMTSPQVRKDSP